MSGGERPLTVLMVDDSPEDVAVVRRHLRRAGTSIAPPCSYEVVNLQLAGEALTRLRDLSLRPDVMLLDYHLPDMSGLELLDVLMDAPDIEPVPVVMLTGSGAQVDTAVAAMRRGALDYLPKDTLTADVLRRAVDGAIKRFASERLLAAQREELERLYAAERVARTEAEAERTTAQAERSTAEAERVRAMEANRAKSQFLANMSHELRTPLNAIGGYAQLVELGVHGPVTAEQRQALARIQSAQRHLLGLINEVLNFAKMEAGRVEFHLEPVPVAEVVADVIALVHPQAGAKGLVLTASSPPPHRPYPLVWADREKLSQVLLNLLSNAVKFTPPSSSGTVGRVMVDVATRSDGSDPGDVVFLRIADTGVGIAREKQASVFEPFVQLPAELTREHQGTGLGLAISRDLARGMGGDIRVRSEPGEGAVFTVTLRRAEGGGSDPASMGSRHRLT